VRRGVCAGAHASAKARPPPRADRPPLSGAARAGISFAIEFGRAAAAKHPEAALWPCRGPQSRPLCDLPASAAANNNNNLFALESSSAAAAAANQLIHSLINIFGMDHLRRRAERAAGRRVPDCCRPGMGISGELLLICALSSGSYLGSIEWASGSTYQLFCISPKSLESERRPRRTI
jgi:hypothetical protein